MFASVYSLAEVASVVSLYQIQGHSLIHQFWWQPTYDMNSSGHLSELQVSLPTKKTNMDSILAKQQTTQPDRIATTPYALAFEVLTMAQKQMKLLNCC